MTPDGLKYLQHQRALRFGAADTMIKAGYKPTWDVVAKCLYEACTDADPIRVESALGYTQTDHKGDTFRFSLYDDPAYNSNGQARSRGASAWVALLDSGKPQDDPDLRECAKLLAEKGRPITSPLFIDTDGKPDGAGQRLLHRLASLGWLDLARDIEKWSDQNFPPLGASSDQAGFDDIESTPISQALRCGQGSFALALLAIGSPCDHSCTSEGIHGFADTASPQHGCRRPVDAREKLLALRIGMYKTQWQTHDRWNIYKLFDDPLASDKTLLLWLQDKALQAQCLLLPREERTMTLAHSLFKSEEIEPEEADLNLRSAEPLESRKSAFSWLVGSKASQIEAASKHAKIHALKTQAESTISARIAQTPPVGEILAMVDKGQLALAQKAFEQLPDASKLPACVAFLGLAKTSYWDMPAPGGVGDECRHPLRWGGFKLALAAAGALANDPIEGLSGMNLLGLSCALGWEDACAAILESGARADADPLTDAAAPLSLAIAHGNMAIARALLSSGATPLEGAIEGPLGFQRKAWAIHQAFERKEVDFVETMLALDPRASKLPDRDGHTLYEKARLAADAARAGKERDFYERIASLAERAALCALPPSRERDHDKSAPKAL